MKRLALLLLLFPVFIFAQDDGGLNAGFVDGLWYSHEPIFAEDTVRIYVALRNNTNDDITGTVVFEDNGEVFATRNVSAISGRLVEAWADWNASYGEHTLGATLTDIRIDGVGSSNRYASVTSALAKDFLIIDYDTDGDDIGNLSDPDDDNDGVSDIDEEQNGTDPLVADIPDEETAEAEEDSEHTESEITANIDEVTQQDNRSGLENYIENETLQKTFQTVTNIVNNTKTNLDSYRTSRNSNRAESLTTETTTESVDEEVEATTTETVSSELPADFQPLGGATKTKVRGTITREQAEDTRTGFFGVIKNVVGQIIGSIYTFILWLLSFTLSYPALVELVLLILIIWMIFRTARRLARRPIQN